MEMITQRLCEFFTSLPHKHLA
ncbi:hypothetical protein DDM85_03315 [Vibrio cholerae]|nr:hypothetical protein [Vibrio cholerae]EGR0602060.1 hypothetical protein [Vibrio cholerae]EGR4262703.1 hypothetical protein [Vibrio cholerae]EGR4315604.1 hypothetical protein [Vibrio cholerae]